MLPRTCHSVAVMGLVIFALLSWTAAVLTAVLRTVPGVMAKEQGESKNDGDPTPYTVMSPPQKGIVLAAEAFIATLWCAMCGLLLLGIAAMCLSISIRSEHHVEANRHQKMCESQTACWASA